MGATTPAVSIMGAKCMRRATSARRLRLTLMLAGAQVLIGGIVTVQRAVAAALAMDALSVVARELFVGALLFRLVVAVAGCAGLGLGGWSGLWKREWCECRASVSRIVRLDSKDDDFMCHNCGL